MANTDKDFLKEFYFNNTYDRRTKAENMQNNVYFDLMPFRKYIQASIDHIGNSTAEGADVVIADKLQDTYLEPQFSLIKPQIAGSSFSVKKPENVFMLTADKEFDSQSFEVNGRQGRICTHENCCDIFNGNYFIRGESISPGKFFLYDDEDLKDEAIECQIREINYAEISSYRIDGVTDVTIEAVKEDELVFRTNADVSYLKEIEIFGEKHEVTGINKIRKAEITSSDRRINIKMLDDSLYAVIPPLQENKKTTFFANGIPVDYSIISITDFEEAKLQKLFHTKDITIQNGRLAYSGNTEKNVNFIGLSFKICSEKLSFRKTLRDNNSKYIGTVIEVLTDNKSIKDLESNTDAFFKETTERLTDSLPYRQGKSRSFKIGWTDEDQNLLEIAEETKNGLVKIEDLPSHLFAVPNDWQLKKQQSAITKLSKMPCSEQAGLLELFERTKDERGRTVRNWDYFSPTPVENWYLLTKEDYDGCDEQREFVRKALATPDFAFLDGPPGSGKTTTLLELIAQLAVQEKKILLTASTNAAVDNILERLNKLPQEIQDKILAVRIGNKGSISDTVNDYTLTNVPEEYREEILHRANLVCGTIFGVLKHPAFNLSDRNQPVRPLYDYLIIDEASKTTFQDFLIPAIYSKRWILSGDLKQLTPYVEQETIQSSLEEMPEFDKKMQDIQTILCLCRNKQIIKNNMRFYITVSADLIKAAEKLVTDPSDKTGIICKNESLNPYAVSVNELKNADSKAVILYGAKILFIEDSVLEQVRNFLPSDFVPMYDIANDKHYSDLFLVAAAKHYFSKKRPQIELGSSRDKKTCRKAEEIADYWTKARKEHSWAQEITWRLCRIQELFLEDNDNETVERYKREIEERMPSSQDKKEKAEEYCNALTGIALPSILQLLQEGLNEDVKQNRKKTTLNDGFEQDDFDPRHTMLTHQHRMHPEISAFPAEHIYHGEALQDGSEMTDVRDWNCGVFGNNRDLWLNTDGNSNRDCTNENQTEINVITQKIKDFTEWTKDNPNFKDPNGMWSVACLTYYKKQERKLKNKVKELFNKQKEIARYADENRNLEVFIYTVDKFQGREADVVFISFVKTGKAPLGFMDSPNRLNVALTRAKFQRVIVGSREYFKKQNKSALLKSLAENSNKEANNEI